MLSLEKLFNGLEVSVEPFAVCVLRGYGRLQMGRHERATLHYAVAGQGRLHVGSDWQIPVAAHTVVIVPRRTLHTVEAGRSAEAAGDLPGCAPLADGWRRIEEGEGSCGVQMICGALDATYGEASGLFDYLSEPICERLQAEDPLRSALNLMIHELADPRPGTQTLAASLLRQCLVLLLGRHVDAGRCQVPWLAALEDERLGRTVGAMLDHPEADHSLDQLAALAGMSRSSFAAHFSNAFGRGPADFLREVRLRRAARLLRSSDRPIKTVAARVGYDSRSYFSRAFKDLFGVAPADYRLALEPPGRQQDES